MRKWLMILFGTIFVSCDNETTTSVQSSVDLAIDNLSVDSFSTTGIVTTNPVDTLFSDSLIKYSFLIRNIDTEKLYEADTIFYEMSTVDTVFTQPVLLGPDFNSTDSIVVEGVFPWKYTNFGSNGSGSFSLEIRVNPVHAISDISCANNFDALIISYEQQGLVVNGSAQQ